MNLNQKILKKAEDDWLYLAEVYHLIEQENMEKSEPELKEMVLEVVNELVSAGLLEVGSLSGVGGKFQSWSLSNGAKLEQIRNKWDALDKPISLGDVCWLANTPEGDALASKLNDLDE